MRFFVGIVTPRIASNVADSNPRAIRYYHKIRQVLAFQLDLQAEEMFGGELELDESYFGGVRKGKHRRGSAGKVVMFAILKRCCRLHTKLIQDTKTDRLMPTIRRKVVPDSMVYTDDGLEIPKHFFIPLDTDPETMLDEIYS